MSHPPGSAYSQPDDVCPLEIVAGGVLAAYLVQELRPRRTPNVVALTIAIAVNALLVTQPGNGRAAARFLGAALIGDLGGAGVALAVCRRHEKPRLDRLALAHHILVPLLAHRTVTTIDSHRNSFAVASRYLVVWAVLLSEISSVPLHARGFFPRGSLGNRVFDVLFRVLFVVTRLVIMPLAAWRGAELEPPLTAPLMLLVVIQIIWGVTAARAACKKRGRASGGGARDRRDPLADRSD